MLGLRLVEGIERARVDELLAGGTRGPGRRAAIERGRANGLLEDRDGRLRLTARGLLLADGVIGELL